MQHSMSTTNCVAALLLTFDFRKNTVKYSLLCSKLRQPFSHLIAYAASLKCIAQSLSRFVPHEATSWRQVTDDWRNFSHQIRLLSWQASLGRDSLVSFELDDLYPQNDVTPAEFSRYKLGLNRLRCVALTNIHLEFNSELLSNSQHLSGKPNLQGR
jgi:hypothetical protein